MRSLLNPHLVDRVIDQAGSGSRGSLASMASMLLDTSAFSPGDFYDTLRSAQSREWAERRVKRGIECARGQKYGEAIGFYDEAIQQCPSLADAFVARGAAFANMQRLTTAVDDFRHAARLDPDHANAAQYLRVTLAKVRAEEEAIEASKAERLASKGGRGALAAVAAAAAAAAAGGGAGGGEGGSKGKGGGDRDRRERAPSNKDKLVAMLRKDVGDESGDSDGSDSDSDSDSDSGSKKRKKSSKKSKRRKHGKDKKSKKDKDSKKRRKSSKDKKSKKSKKRRRDDVVLSADEDSEENVRRDERWSSGVSEGEEHPILNRKFVESMGTEGKSRLKHLAM
jgi:tetratricopeptide (TPR) repeat protein